MAIRSTADRTVFYLYNRNRVNAVPPIVFVDYHNNSHFSFSIWVKVLDATVPDTLLVLAGTDGSQLDIGHDGTNWQVRFRTGSTVLSYAPIAPVSIGVYTLICFTKDDLNNIFYTGTEINPNAPLTHVTLTEVLNFVNIFAFDFDHIAFVSRLSWAICNFKYWNVTLNLGQFKEQAHYWDSVPRNIIGIGPEPIWSSTLRTPGDISNHAQHYSYPNWALSFAYDFITPNSASLIYETDPAFMRDNATCPTWLYAEGINGTITIIGAESVQNYLVVSANPGVTPTLQTDYLGDRYFRFQDRGALPVSFPFDGTAEYCGFAYTIGPGVANSATWAAFLDENGIAYTSKDPPIPVSFQMTTNIPIKPTPFPTTIYLWKFGGLFTWNAGPSSPTATANLSYLFAFAKYTGLPNGIPTPPVNDLRGLFIINKGGKSVDRYYRGTELKIPNPTIKTAYIGE